MMRWIVGSSLKFRLLMIAVAAGTMFFGIMQLGDTSVDILPEFTPPTVEVQAEALGLSAEEVEQFITVPLEQDLLNGVAFLDEIHSASLPGLSSVVMTFEPGTDLLDARQVVGERLAQAVGVAGLPEVSKPPQMLQPLSSTSRVSMIKLSSESVSPIEMSVLARWVISPRLQGVNGVANVAIWGQRERQLQVLADPERLRDQDVSLQQVIRTAGNALEVSPLSFLEASSPGTGGFIDTANQRLQIFHEQTITTPGELAQVPLEDTEGNAVFARGEPVTLGEVTEVVEDHQPLIGDALCSDGECLLLVVEKFPGANTLEVTEGVEAALEAMRPGLPGVEIDTSIYRPATFIETSFTNLGWTLLIGMVLLLLLIGAFFWDWRTGLICAVAIPLSLVAAGLVLYYRGVTLNTMLIAGLVMALVALVDDAIFDVERFSRRLRERRADGSDVPPGRTILEASLEMRSAFLFGALIIFAALLPVFFMDGRAGAFLPPIALSYMLAVVASMVVALTITPALSFMLLSGAPQRRPSPVVTWLQRGYDKVSGRIVPRLGSAMVAVIAVVVLGLVALPFLDDSLSPSLKERDLLIQMETAPGTSLAKMNELTGRAVQELGSLPGVDNVGADVGRAIMSDQVVNVNTSEIWVKLDPSSDYHATVATIEDVVDGYPEVSSNVLTYSEERITDVLEQTDDEIVVRVYGENSDVIQDKAQEVRGLVSGIDGVEEARAEIPEQEPTLEVEVDLARAQALGVKPGDVRRAAATLLSGITVGNLFEQQKVFDVVVWGAPEIRQSVSDVRQLLIDTPNGGHVRLGDVATTRVAPNPTVIRHESVASYVDVSARVSGRDVGAVAGDVERAIQRVDFPFEHRAELLEGFTEQQADRSRVLAVALAAAVGIFLLLQAAFNSWRLATLAFLTLPLALVGGVLATLLDGGTITLGSIVGFVAVLGVAARGGVVLIRHYQRLERHEGESFGPDLVVRGTREQLVPILMTALATSTIFAPFVIAGDAAGLEIVRPMAVVILGGLLSSTLLNLVVVPAFYLRYGFVSMPDRSEEELLVTPSEVDTVAG
ncbi:MAG: efflux RND transporter permease subunit [Actinomycetota bacterium]